MSKKFDQELLELDLYDILGVSIESDEKKIKKSFRKKALACHPDKNPDNPDAANEFNKLKKILEILLDPGARRAYDKVLKGRKAAALRAKETNLKNQKLREDLERREKAAKVHQEVAAQLSEEERLRREIKRLEEEGELLIAEELENLNREAEALVNLSKSGQNGGKSGANSDGADCRVKAKWRSTDEWEGYTEEEVRQLFYKWGEINAVVINKKGSKNSALIEYKTVNGANLAAQFERGLPGKPVKVSLCSKKKKDEEEEENKNNDQSTASSRDFESVAEMNRRREAERKRLIDEMMKTEDL